MINWWFSIKPHRHSDSYYGRLTGISYYKTIYRKWCIDGQLAILPYLMGGSVAQWLACWTQCSRAWVQIAAAVLSGNSLRQTVCTHRSSVHQAAKSVAALLRVVRVTAGLAESNSSLPPGLWLTSPAGWLPRTGISSGTLHSVIEYGLHLPFLPYLIRTGNITLTVTPLLPTSWC